MTGPLFSIVTPVYDPPLDVLEETIDSVLAQTSTTGSWILVDDCSPTATWSRRSLRCTRRDDPRIRLIERDDQRPHRRGLQRRHRRRARRVHRAARPRRPARPRTRSRSVAEAIEPNDDVDYLYSDEDKVDDDGRFYDAFHKPDWSPERLRGQMYTCHLSVLRTSVVREVGGFREGYDGSQDHDLVLRVTERRPARRPHPRGALPLACRRRLGRRRRDRRQALRRGRRRSAPSRTTSTGSASRRRSSTGAEPGPYRHPAPARPRRCRVSVVIPTLGQSGLVWGARRVHGRRGGPLAARTRRPRGPRDRGRLRRADARRRCSSELRRVARRPAASWCPTPSPSTSARRCNLGRAHVDGRASCVFLNDDIEVISERLRSSTSSPRSSSPASG